MGKKNNKRNSSIIFIFSTIIISTSIISISKKIKTWIINNPWWVLFIIFILIIFLISTIIIIISNHSNHKKNLLDLEIQNEEECTSHLNELQQKINNYEKIYPNLKNYEHPYDHNNDFHNNLGIIGEINVKNKLAKIAENDNFQLFNNLYIQSFNNKINQIDHLLISNNCIFVIETKNWSINTYGNYYKKNWIQYHGNNREQIPSPLLQNRSHIETIIHILKKEKINSNQLTIFNIVVFVKNNLKIKENIETLNNINEKALNFYELQEYIQNQINKSLNNSSNLIDQKNNITEIILKYNKYENIEIHRKQLKY